MSRKIKIRSFEKYACSPFCEYELNNGIDVEFLLSLSRPSQNVLMYLAHRHDLADEKFLFDPEEFNKFSGYRSSGNLTRGLAELCFKGLLAKTRSTFLYWVNNTLLNTEVSSGIISADSVKVSLKSDIEFLISLSRSAQNVIRYLFYKRDAFKRNFLFNLKEFNEFIGYKSKFNLFNGICELHSKGLLEKENSTFKYCISKGFLIDKLSLSKDTFFKIT